MFASEVLESPDKQPNNSQQVHLTTLVRTHARSLMAQEDLPDKASKPEREHEGRSATDEDRNK